MKTAKENPLPIETFESLVLLIPPALDIKNMYLDFYIVIQAMYQRAANLCHIK